MSDLVKIERVSKDFPSGSGKLRVIKDLSLTIDDGEFLTIVGPSGSGKTTLLNMMAALTRPTSGRIIIDGVEVSNLMDARATRFRAENIGLVFQFFNLFPALTTLENVELGVALKLRDARERRERSRRYLEMVGLGGAEGRFPSQLSGGEQQRVAVARALAMEPRLLLADEPTGNLDAETAQEVWRLLGELNRKTGTTVVAVTHWVDMARASDRMVHLRSGAIEKVTELGGR
ncbi:MAG: ABC transporter ATP-binding protein [Thermoplasmatota archaeon]